MIPAIIGAVAAIGSAVASSVISANAAKKAQKLKEKYLNQAERENEAWYARNYNRNALEEGTGAYGWKKLTEAIRKRNQSLRGQQSMGNLTEDAVAAEKERNAQALSDYAAQVVASDQDNKSKVDATYISQKNSIASQKAGVQADYETAKGQATATAAQGVISAAGNFASGLSSTRSAGNENGTKNPENTTRSASNEDIAKSQANNNAALYNNVANQADSTRSAWEEQQRKNLYGNGVS